MAYGGRSRRGFAQTVYFQQVDEVIIDQLKGDIEEVKVFGSNNRPIASFSAFIREAMHEKLERSRAHASA